MHEPSTDEAPARRAWSRGRHRVRAGVGVGLLLAMACDDHLCTPVLQSEYRQLELIDSQMVHGACRRLREPAPVLVGTRFCPVLSCNGDTPGCVISGEDDEDGRELDPGDVVACFDHQVEGAEWDEGCLVPNAPGELRWTFTPISCPASTAYGYAPQADTLTLPVVEASEVVAWLDHPGDAFALRSLVGVGGEPLPPSLALSPGQTVHVIAGQPIELAVVLTHPELGTVGWRPTLWTLSATVEGTERTVSLDSLGLVEVTVQADERMMLSMERDGIAMDLGVVQGVAAESITALEIVPGFVETDSLSGSPFGARAVAWAGDVAVYGLPVDWTVTEGLLPLWRDLQRPWSPDYIALIDEDGGRCHPAPERKVTQYRARLRATYGELTDEVTLTWEEQPDATDSLVGDALEQLSGEGFEPSPLCEGPGFAVQSCACRSGGGGAGGSLLWASLVLWGWRRRRGLGATVSGRTVDPDGSAPSSTEVRVFS